MLPRCLSISACTGKNDDLGKVVIPGETVLEASGERLEFQLKHKEENAGFIALRIRPATSYDRDFLKSLGNNKADFMGIRTSTTKAMEPIGGATSLMKNMMTKYEKDGKRLSWNLFKKMFFIYRFEISHKSRNIIVHASLRHRAIHFLDKGVKKVRNPCVK